MKYNIPFYKIASIPFCCNKNNNILAKYYKGSFLYDQKEIVDLIGEAYICYFSCSGYYYEHSSWNRESCYGKQYLEFEKILGGFVFIRKDGTKYNISFAHNFTRTHTYNNYMKVDVVLDNVEKKFWLFGNHTKEIQKVS